jgi:type III pantothenate kinase
MILTIVIGNTNTRFVRFRGRRVVSARELPTVRVCRGSCPQLGRAGAVALASVVPAATQAVRACLRAVPARELLIVGPRTRTGLRFSYRRRDLGADRVCAAVGARHRFPDRNLIVLDFGTATTVNVVLREGIFAGGAILPGIRMSLDALAAGTAGLPRVLPRKIPSPVQHSTRAAMQAGVAGLFTGGVDHIIDQVERDLGRRFLVVATGGAARSARRCTGRIGLVRPNLASEGLAGLWYLNCGERG